MFQLYPRGVHPVIEADDKLMVQHHDDKNMRYQLTLKKSLNAHVPFP